MILIPVHHLVTLGCFSDGTVRFYIAVETISVAITTTT